MRPCTSILPMIYCGVRKRKKRGKRQNKTKQHRDERPQDINSQSAMHRKRPVNLYAQRNCQKLTAPFIE